MSVSVQSQVIAGLIVGLVIIVLTWLGRRIARSFAADIKETVKKETAPIIAQFSNNGGNSLKDAIDRLDGKLDAVKDMTQAQGKVLGEHIAFHKGQESAGH